MSFTKKATSANKMSCQALYIPKTESWAIFNTSRIKTASFDKSQPIDIGGFDLEAAIKGNPDHLFVKVFAIKENEVNDNGDAFSASELRRAAHTFIGVPVFVNHQNDDVEKARGKVVHAWYDEKAGGIYTINMVDRTAYPRLARGIEESYITGTSMGAQVGYSLCSACHNKASTADDFCDHIKNRKNKKTSGSMKCCYHDSPAKPEDPCPIDGCKKGHVHEFLLKEAQIFEWNFDIKFIEDSFVVNPACHDCLVCDILNIPTVESKVANLQEQIKKIASSYTDNGKNVSIKIAGKNEINDLNDAMNKLERVTRSMMAQKQQVSLDYVSDIVEALADIQSITNELLEMGYPNLPSPPESEVLYGSGQDASPLGQGSQQVSPGELQPQPQPTIPQGSPSQPSSGALGGDVGTVTRPNFSSGNLENKEDFLKVASNMIKKVHSLNENLYKSLHLLKIRRASMSDSAIQGTYKAVSGNKSVIIASDSSLGEGVHVAKLLDDNIVSIVNSSEFDNEMRLLVERKPQEAAERILKDFTKESGITMADNIKTVEAAGKGVEQSQVEVITQKQLENSNLPLHPRTNEEYTTITEGKDQIGGKVRVNDTTTDNGQVRTGTYETITEVQLASIKDGYLTRWNEFPEVITEKQWDEMSRAVGSTLKGTYTDEITQGQLTNLRDNHHWTDPDFITEVQLKDQKASFEGGKGEIGRWKGASVEPKSLVKAALSAISDAIANYGMTPTDIAKVVSAMNVNPQSQMKAAYLILVNAAPGKSELRKAERKRNGYFGKQASASMKSVDSFLAAMSDNIGYLKAENFLTAVRFIVSDKKAFAQAESDAFNKIASSQNENELPIVDEEMSLRNAFAEINRSDDGLYAIRGTIAEDLGNANPQNRDEFMSALNKFAAQEIPFATTIMKVNLGKDSEGEFSTFEVIAKETEKLTAQEKIAADKYNDKTTKVSEDTSKPKTASRSKARESLIKEAQMMGGQMGGGMGGGAMGGGGAGASLPTPPADPAAGGQPPVESFNQEPGADEADAGDGDLTAMPPGSICPVCGSEDVDIIGGKGKCNNCSSEFIFKVNVEVTKWSGLTDDGQESGGEEGEGFPMPEDSAGAAGAEGAAGVEGGAGAAGGQIPVAAMTLLKPSALKKIAENKIELFKVSPLTGSTNTVKINKNEFFCLDTGTKYSVHLATDQKTKKIFAEWRWTPKHPDSDCPSCQRAKTSLVKAIKSYGLTEDQFEALSFKEKGKVILALHEKGLFKQVKTASKNGSPISDYKLAYSVGDKFPIESCREKLARRFGENALAMSGPCEGSNLADCVCNKLKSAGIYSDGLATKIAATWSDCDGSIECIEDYVRSGLTMKQAATVCESMKIRYAQSSDMLADDLDSTVASNDPVAGNAGMGGMGDKGACGGMGDADGGEPSLFDNDADPFASDDSSPLPETGPEMGENAAPGATDIAAPAVDEGNTVHLDLDLDVISDLVNSVKDAVDKMTGGNPGNVAVEVSGDINPAATETPVETVPGAVDEIPSDNGEGINGNNGGDNNPDGDKPTPGGPGGGGSPKGVIENVVPSTAVEEVIIEKVPPHDESSEGHHDSKGNVSHDEGHDESSEEVHVHDDEEEKSKENDEEKEDSKPDFLNKEGDDSEEKESEDPIMTEAESLAKNFKAGKIASTGKSVLDLSNVIKILNKKADAVKFEPAQESEGTGTYTKPEKSTIGQEKKFEAESPDAPTGKATIGEESADLQKLDKPEVFTGNAEMGHEKEQGYTSEQTNKGTGGVDGAGTSKAASSQSKKTKDMTSNLADRIVQSSESKLEKPKPVSDTKDIGTISNNKDHSNTPEGLKRKPFAEGEKPEVPEGDSKAFIGHEEESIGDVPKTEKNAPSFPAGGGRDTAKFDKNEKNAPEKMNEDKGTVIAQGNADSNKSKKDAAFKLAGYMLERRMIQATQLADEVEKLMKYDADHIKMLEKTLLASSGNKGLDTVSNGVETPMIVPETSNIKTASDELSKQLEKMFTLTKRIDAAQDDPNIELNKHFK